MEACIYSTNVSHLLSCHGSNHVRDENDESKNGEPANQFALASSPIDSSASWLTLTPHMTAGTQHTRLYPSISPPTGINRPFPIMDFQAISVWP